MRRAFGRGLAIFVAALALPAFLAGSAGAAKSSSSGGKLSSATLNGDGSTFQLGFNQVVIGAFKQQQQAVTINYQGTGSGQGRTDFANKVVDFAGTDAPYAAGAAPTTPFFYFPTVVAPITVSYNVSGVKTLRLDADTLAKIFQAQITTWNDPAIKALNPGVKLPGTTITVVHRSDGSGTTQNFTHFLQVAAPSTWTLGSGSTVQWPASTQGVSGNAAVGSLVGQTDGGIGYVDYSDAVSLKLKFAMVKNAAGSYIAPTLTSATAAVTGITVNADLTFDPINAPGKQAYPITSPTWVIAYQTQSNAAKGNALKGWLAYIYGTGSGQGQSLAPSVYYAPLPSALIKTAKAQLAKLTVPSS
jgi:phosphate transport system substrate-binding protein